MISLDADDLQRKELRMVRLSLTTIFAEIHSSTIFKAIRLALIVTAFIAWALTAYARVEDPNLNPEVIPANEELWKWGLRVSTAMIGFMGLDILNALQNSLLFWQRLNPIHKFGTLILLVLVATNLVWSLKGRYSAIKSVVPLGKLPDMKQSINDISTEQDHSPKVFISYSHDSKEHKDLVLKLAQRMRRNGINCDLDLYDTSPKKGWRRWMENQIKEASYVLVICTQTYCRRFEGKEEDGKGLGVKWEAAIIAREIYENDMHNERFLPVIFTEADRIHIPDVLRDFTYYQIDDPHGYDTLYRKLTNQPAIVKEPLGSIRPLPPINQEQPDQ